MPDTKTIVTALFGGILLAAPMTAHPHRYPGARLLLVCAPATGVLGWIWMMSPRERGDAFRMGLALTVLFAALALGAGYWCVTHSSDIRPKSVAGIAIAVGALLFLRVWLPDAVGGKRR